MMEENTAAVQFIKVSKENVLAFLEQGKQRVVIAKAGYFVDEINALLGLAGNGVRCELYIDTDEKSIRYGFGEQAALERINENLELLHVQSANYIRMAIVIVDEAVMVYSPVALSWEEVPENIDFPNGFIGGKDLAGSLLRQIQGERLQIDIEGLNINIEICPVTQKAPEEIKQEISQTISTLKENPPVNPAELRKTTFYRHKYKLLKTTVHGVKIKDKTIALRPFNRLLQNINYRLISSWNVLTSEDVKRLSAISDFLEIYSILTDECTLDAGRYGVIIKTKDKALLEKCIDCAVLNLKDCLGKIDAENPENNPENTDENPGHDHPSGSLSNTHGEQSLIDSQEEQKRTEGPSLASLLKESRAALVDHLFSQAIGDKDCWDNLFINDKTLYRQMLSGIIPQDEAVKQAVETFVDYKLNFPDAQGMIDLICVEFDYYDISDEMLAKEDFIEIIEKLDIEVRDYQEGYEKQKQMTSFPE